MLDIQVKSLNLLSCVSSVSRFIFVYFLEFYHVMGVRQYHTKGSSVALNISAVVKSLALGL